MLHRTSSRIVIVGGGIAGLSVAARLAQAGYPVTVLEASQLGFGASTRNQGWLYSGAWFAPLQPDLARHCYESLRQTLDFCPECVEPNSEPMVYLISDGATDPTRWTAAWDTAEIPYERLRSETVFERFPGLAISKAHHAFQLPDRAIRTDLLLWSLAETAKQAGAEIIVGASVSKLIQQDDRVEGVETAQGDIIPARLVILAGNARGGSLFPGFGTEAVGSQSEMALVALKTHLAAVRPQISRSPLCVVDAAGFNHIPHSPLSIFGSNRWLPVHQAEDEQSMTDEIDRLWNRLNQFFPEVRRDEHLVKAWAGNTLQAMHIEQIEPGHVPLPTVVDHEREHPPVENLLSVFPGRASLWPHLAEQTRRVVMEKLSPVETQITAPPWETKRCASGSSAFGNSCTKRLALPLSVLRACGHPRTGTPTARLLRHPNGPSCRKPAATFRTIWLLAPSPLWMNNENENAL